MRRPTRAVVRPAATAGNVVNLFAGIDLSVLSGVPDTGLAPGAIEQLYMPGESLFGAVAVEMRAHGWAVYPQERDEKRRPAMVDKRAVKIGKYFDKAPTPAETRRWSLQAAAANCAILMGPASGNTFCIDIDITDEDQSRQVQEIAARILSGTPLQRVGTAPKIALIYRVADAKDLPPNRSYRLANEDGTAGEQFEILSKGKAITAYGQHHKTGAYFKWFGGKVPVVHGPEYAPLVTPDQIQLFIDAVAEELGFHVKPAAVLSAAFTGEMASIEGWSLPTVSAGEVLDGIGRIKDGREGWLKALTFATTRQNAYRLADKIGNDWVANEAGVAAGIEVLVQFCREKMVLDDRFTDGGPLRHEVEDRLRRDVGKLERGEIRSVRSAPSASRAIQTQKFTQPACAVQDAALWHLPARDQRKALDFAAATMPDAVIAASRALRTDRTETSIRVDLEIAIALDMFFDRIYQTEAGLKAQVHVLASPAGSGKTTKTLLYIANDPRTYQYDDLPRDQRPGPLVFVLPTYNNISEVRARATILGLNPTMSDEDLAEAAAAKGLMSVDDALVDIERIRKSAKGTALKTMVYMGKIPAGCHKDMVAKVQMLSDAGFGSAGLCHARVAIDQPKGTPKDTPREYEDQYCPHYSTCLAIAQRAEIADMHIVFLPHAFMSLSIPEELKQIRGVIADERIFSMFVHSAEFGIEALRRPRREPKLTKDEHEAGITPEDILGQRDEAAYIAARALEAGSCPIAALAEFREVRPKMTVTGLDLVKAAVRVTGGASAASGIVSPTITDWDLAAICEAPSGKDVKAEWRFWSIIRDRIEALAEGKKLPPNGRKIQYRHYVANGVDHEMIRISWTTAPNWPAAPVLLLDASANEGIVQAIFPDRDVVMHRVEADMNARIVAVVDKRYSTSSLICKSDAEPATRAACAANIESIRDRLVFLSAVHANGRIVACASRAVRRAINADWAGPGNVDWIHFGAERGLNFAEKHIAAIVIGRMELPVWMYDGLACALAGDNEDLVLLDPLGTGLDAAGERLQQTLDTVTLHRRDGADLQLLTARNPSGWLRVVQAQFREEGILQALCRIRPVYREDTPTVYLFCQSIPESLIIDEICSGEDLRPGYQPLLEACRMTGGIIDYVVAADQRNDIATSDRFKAMFNAMPKELRGQFSVVDWIPADGSRVVHAGVPSYIANPSVAVENALRWADIDHDGKPTLVRQAERVEPAGPRPVDDLVTEAGTFDERRARERLGLEQAVERLAAASLYVPASGKHPVGAGDLAGTRLWLSGHALVHGIEKPKAVEPAPKSILEEYMESEAIAL